jgi:hypothetical protein
MIGGIQYSPQLRPLFCSTGRFAGFLDAGLGILGGTVNARDDNVIARARIHVYLRQARPKIVSVLFVT